MRETLLAHLKAPGTADAPLELVPLEGRRDGIETGILLSQSGGWWWVAGGIPRLLPAALYRRPDLENAHGATLGRLGLVVRDVRPNRRALESKTIDRFGTEWLRFRDWGWHESPPPGADPLEFHGGLIENTRAAFRSKTFLEGRVAGKLCLDAGCGNGRFTRAALDCGASEVIGVDLGWGVEAFHEHHRADPRVHVVQASLFDLPVRGVDVAFSIGVLMHTGDAARAFRCIAEVVRPGGEFAVRLYHRGNWAYEATDRFVRAFTTNLSKRQQSEMADLMAGFGKRIIESDGGEVFGPTRRRWYQVLRNWPTTHHNLDWWTAPVASHHTAAEVCAWGERCGLEVAQSDPKPGHVSRGFWDWPEALTVRFVKPHSGATRRNVATPVPAAV